jgi:hypothetical protein
MVVIVLKGDARVRSLIMAERDKLFTQIIVLQQQIEGLNMALKTIDDNPDPFEKKD